MRFHEPLLLPFVSIAAGIAIASRQNIPLREAGAAGAAMAVLALAGYLAGSRRLAFVTCLGGLVFAGIAIVASRQPPARPRLTVRDNVPAIFEGCVVDPALVAADRERFTVELAPGARAQVSLSARSVPGNPTGIFPDLPYGTHMEFQGKVRQPHNYDDPGTFDSVNYLARQQIYWTAAGDASNVHVLPGKCGNPLIGFIFAIRSAALNRLDHLYADDD